MDFIQWNNEYSVGVLELDKHHQRILGIINSLNKSIEENHSKEIIEQVLDKLIDYAVYHFGAEEKYFEKYNYPQTFTHKMEHQKFIKKVHAFEKEFKEGKLILSVEIMNFLRDWIVNHIHGTDKKYSSFFADKNLD